MNLRTISLFSGVGGLDFGFEAAGFSTSVALDLDPVACSTLRRNRPKWRVIEGDLGQIESAHLLEKAGLAAGEADVLIGGPPCQPFSKSGYWANGDAARLDDPRADTLSQFLRVLRDTQPRAFLLENVLGLIFRGKREGLERLERGIDEINRATGARYSFSYQPLNAAAFGVPQLRERVFIVGARDGTKFRFPERTHASVDETGHGLLPYKTAWDALGDLPSDPDSAQLRPSGKWGDLLASIPEGQNYLWHTERGGGRPLFGWRRRYWNFLLKLAKDRPSWTIQAQPGPGTGPFHWRNRRLAASELARLQTFPDGLVFPANLSDAQRLIGNAVPSALAEVLALEIRRQFFSAPRRDVVPSLLRPGRSDMPSPEPTKSVPRKYLVLMGTHAAHPGTGRGHRAAARQAAA